MRLKALLPFVFSAACSIPCAAQPVQVLGHTPPIAYATFSDPNERAFTLDVPRAWSTRGGLFRYAPVDTRSAVDVTSPDGAVHIRSGDQSVPTFTVPNQMLAMGGFREGSWYDTGYGVKMIVQRYLPGAMFAEDYVRRTCQGARITSRENRPDLANAVNAIYQRYGGSMAARVRVDMGEVRFECNGQAGYYFAGTLLVTTQTSALWHVDNLVGYMAPAAKVALAESVMLRMVRTYKQSPEWLRMQSNITMSTSRIVAQTNDQISDSMSKAFNDRWKREDNVFRKDTNARRGTTDLVDSETGETWNVTGGKSYYWRRPGSDTIVGTDSTQPPGQGYTQLREY